ncbi:biotin/lipoyl-containing protein [Mycobacterium tilburgii]|uniref:biotin/lipoyl-containing protein n=1 Tax=Mycobacterium tilburgii TaxID=44467 RepID=UPI003899328C
MVSVSVAEGDRVSAGQTIATIEAMKMEAPITAPKDGTVARVAVFEHRTGGGRRSAGGARLTRGRT